MTIPKGATVDQFLKFRRSHFSGLYSHHTSDNSLKEKEGENDDIP